MKKNTLPDQAFIHRFKFPFVVPALLDTMHTRVSLAPRELIYEEFKDGENSMRSPVFFSSTN